MLQPPYRGLMFKDRFYIIVDIGGGGGVDEITLRELLAAIATAPALSAGEFSVTTAADTGPGSFRQAIEAAKTKETVRNRVAVIKQEPLQKPSEIAQPPAPPQKRFTLRFASDEALEALIAAGKVNFYAIAGKNAWRLRLSGGRPGYIAAEFPRQIYEMETPTVPIDYTAVFQQQVAAFGRRTLTWGVTLPGRTADAINQKVSGRKGGELIITADGEVKLIQMLHNQPGKE